MRQAEAVLPVGDEAGVNQYLSFTLGEEEYGIEILKVQEIKGYSGITPIPNMPAYLKGIMNLRGTVIPVVDLRARFSLETKAYDKYTVIVVAMVEQKIIGLVVDAVSDVLDLPPDKVLPPPDMGARVDTRFITGTTVVGEKLVVLLDIGKMLSEDDLVAMNTLSRANCEVETK